ncbi:hypothetical protein I5535_19485 [Rhodobacteraceae bacterium F11138]|nr:hypothetical protein [Rhodobacteraceae bacterium F11138]
MGGYRPGVAQTVGRKSRFEVARPVFGKAPRIFEAFLRPDQTVAGKLLQECLAWHDVCPTVRRDRGLVALARGNDTGYGSAHHKEMTI